LDFGGDYSVVVTQQVVHKAVCLHLYSFELYILKKNTDMVFIVQETVNTREREQENMLNVILAGEKHGKHKKHLRIQKVVNYSVPNHAT